MSKDAQKSHCYILFIVPLYGLYLPYRGLVMWRMYNPNPAGKQTDDCVIRALCKAFNTDWESAYIMASVQGLMLSDMPHKNYVWGDLLREHGFQKMGIPNTCPDCYTVRDFAEEHPNGLYVLGTGEHVVTVVNGDWYDTWDSGQEVPIIVYWRKHELLS